MHRLSPTIVGCASSSSRFSWFAHTPLIANNSRLCLIVFAFQLVYPCTAYRQLFLATLIVFAFQLVCLCTAYRQLFLATLIVFAFQLVCPYTAYRQQLLAAPCRLRVSVGLPMHRLSPTIVGCASSSSCVSWFAHVPLIVCNLCPNQYKYSPMPYA